MPNHYGNTLICATNGAWYDDEEQEPFIDEVKSIIAAGKLINAAVPMPGDVQSSLDTGEEGMYPLWFRWARDAWGTKWGDYDGEFRQMPADGRPPLITFNTAWGPPNESCRAAVREWLAARGIDVHLWIGSDPGNNSTTIIEDWTR